MRNFKIKVELDDGNEISYETTTFIDSDVGEMASRLSKATDYLILKQPDGSATLVNARHIVQINVVKDTDPA